MVIISLSIEDSEEEDGWEEISTQDSSVQFVSFTLYDIIPTTASPCEKQRMGI